MKDSIKSDDIESGQFLRTETGGVVKVGMVSLGCPKNQCDAELMLHKISLAGYRLVNEPGKADVVIINTCGFIQSAKEEAIEEIFEAINRKKDGINKKIIVTGCLAQRYFDEMEKEFPEVDGVLSIGRNDDIVEAVNTVILDRRAILQANADKHNMEGERQLSTLSHYAYLRIADGCDNCCSYCAIPIIRGRFRSRRMENIIKEAEGLAQKGVKELIIVAQDTTRYGLDLYGELKLYELLNKLCEVNEIKWIRLLYCYPERITDELIEVIKEQPKILKYLDMPIQHCNEEILSRMNRTGSNLTLYNLVGKLRRNIQGLVLRSTVLAGFPDESEEQFIELAEFVNNVKFEHLGCFPYSEEEGTVAAEMPYQVNEKERLHRAEIIVEQQEIRAAEFWQSLIGREFEVVVEGYDRYLEMYFGRSYMMAPEIDGMIYFTGDGLKISDFINVKIIDVSDNNLIGESG
jgi:ribosomal protein S12 methylthiotransferase